MSSLDLALIGNCSYGALVNAMGEVVWACMPRFDSDPVFCSLLRARDRPDDFGFYAIDLLDVARAEQHYLINTAAWSRGSTTPVAVWPRSPTSLPASSSLTDSSIRSC